MQWHTQVGLFLKNLLDCIPQRLALTWKNPEISLQPDDCGPSAVEGSWLVSQRKDVSPNSNMPDRTPGLCLGYGFNDYQPLWQEDPQPPKVHSDAPNRYNDHSQKSSQPDHAHQGCDTGNFSGQPIYTTSTSIQEPVHSFTTLLEPPDSAPPVFPPRALMMVGQPDEVEWQGPHYIQCSIPNSHKTHTEPTQCSSQLVHLSGLHIELMKDTTILLLPDSNKLGLPRRGSICRSSHSPSSSICFLEDQSRVNGNQCSLSVLDDLPEHLCTPTMELNLEVPTQDSYQENYSHHSSPLLAELNMVPITSIYGHSPTSPANSQDNRDHVTAHSAFIGQHKMKGLCLAIANKVTLLHFTATDMVNFFTFPEISVYNVNTLQTFCSAICQLHRNPASLSSDPRLVDLFKLLKRYAPPIAMS
ncbi:hypothetical protein J3Q64DRAFT_1693523 [Phycomyces blakesleeanus]|uniref:Uncharacterized protein n=1 Tax=Phycomyces blakesleeanus TaxID=4837 RepID=A0ABR3BFC6_PHYBL